MTYILYILYTLYTYIYIHRHILIYIFYWFCFSGELRLIHDGKENCYRQMSVLEAPEASVMLCTIFLEPIIRNIKPMKFKAFITFWSQQTFSIKNQRANILGFAAHETSAETTEHCCDNRKGHIDSM